VGVVPVLMYIQVKNNVLKLFTKFIGHGKATVIFRHPSHQLFISKVRGHPTKILGRANFSNTDQVNRNFDCCMLPTVVPIVVPLLQHCFRTKYLYYMIIVRCPVNLFRLTEVCVTANVHCMSWLCTG
jgi:hypothetical protein